MSEKEMGMVERHIAASHVWERWAVLQDDEPVAFFTSEDDAKREAAILALRAYTSWGDCRPAFSVALVTMSATLQPAALAQTQEKGDE